MQEIVLDEVYDVWFTSFWQTPVGYGILVLIVLLGIAVLTGMVYGIMLYKRGSTKDQALRSLRSLARSNQEEKKVYGALTSVIKHYAQWRYGMPRGMTDYELTTLLVDYGCDLQQRKDMQRIFLQAQAVKFGHAQVLKETIQQDIVDSITFIESTAKKER